MSIKSRLLQYIDYKGISKYQFYKETGIANGFLDKEGNIGSDKCERIRYQYPDISLDWLISGNGEMIIGEAKSCDTNVSMCDNNEDIKYRLVPILNLDSVGGIHSSNAVIDVKEHILGYEPFTDALSSDRCLIESGDSMAPTIPAGSLMLIREVPNWMDYFGYGNIFVIRLSDGRRITKEVARYEENPKEYVWCKSHNPLVQDEELPKSMIVSVWKVVKVLTNKGW